MHTLIQDIRYAIRQLMKSPGFTAIAGLTLALGIGASATVFSTAGSLLLDPVPYPDATRLANVRTNLHQPLSTPDFLDISQRCSCFSSMAAFRFERFNIGAEKPESVLGVTGTPSLLPTLGVPPMLGRWFTDADAASDIPQSVVLSQGLWERIFGGDPSAIGRTLRLNGCNVQVVGVMPATFVFQTARSEGNDFQLWVPLRLEMNERERSSHWLEAVARLKPGVALEQADAEVRRIGAQLTREHPLSNQNKPFLVRSFVAELTAGARSRLALLLGAVGLVLLMACANVASMLLARGSHRQTEFALRLSLGATRTSVIRLCLAESLVLALLGTLGGVLIASLGTGFLQTVLAIPRTPGMGIRLDTAMLALGGVLALTAAFLSGLPSALAAARMTLFDTVKDGDRSQAGSRTRHSFLRHLVVVQITLAFLLLNGAFLLSRSYLKVWDQNRSLDTDRTVTAGIILRGEQYSSGPSRVQFWENYLERVRAIPGVKCAAMTTKLPLEGGNNTGVLVEGETYDPSVRKPPVENSLVSPGYFPAMGIPLLRGQEPDWQAEKTAVGAKEDSGVIQVQAVVNRAFADRHWPGQDPIGKRFWDNVPLPGYVCTVVGLAENVRQWGAEEAAVPEMYRLYPANPRSRTYLAVRSEMDAARLAPELRHALAAVDGDLALAQVRTLKEVVRDSTRDRRQMVQIINGFMAISVALALVGVYGTVSYNVARKNREVGIRMALGAQRSNIIALFLRQLMPTVGVGLALGAACSIASIRLLRSFVFQVDPIAPWRFAGIALAILLAAALIAWLTALRATRLLPVEPMKEG